MTEAAVTVIAPELARCWQRKGAPHPMNLAAGSYFGGRKPADGLIDWTKERRADLQPDPRRHPPLPRRLYLSGRQKGDHLERLAGGGKRRAGAGRLQLRCWSVPAKGCWRSGRCRLKGKGKSAARSFAAGANQSIRQRNCRTSYNTERYREISARPSDESTADGPLSKPSIKEKSNESTDTRRQRFYRQRPHPKHPRHHRLGGLRPRHERRQARALHRPPPFPFPRGGHHHQQGMDRVQHQEVRRGAAAGGHRHAGHLRQGSAAGLRARLRGEPEDHPPVRQVQEEGDLPLHLRGLRHEPGPGVRRGELSPHARSDQQGALDLLLRQADARPGDLCLRQPRGAAVHPVPPLQLDRPQARQHLTPPRRGVPGC